MDVSLIVFPPRPGGRRVMVRGERAGTATSLADVIGFLRRTDLDDIGVVRVHGPGSIEWRGGGPDAWE